MRISLSGRCSGEVVSKPPPFREDPRRMAACKDSHAARHLRILRVCAHVLESERILKVCSVKVFEPPKARCAVLVRDNARDQ